MCFPIQWCRENLILWFRGISWHWLSQHRFASLWFWWWSLVCSIVEKGCLWILESLHECSLPRTKNCCGPRGSKLSAFPGELFGTNLTFRFAETWNIAWLRSIKQFFFVRSWKEGLREPVSIFSAVFQMSSLTFLLTIFYLYLCFIMLFVFSSTFSFITAQLTLSYSPSTTKKCVFMKHAQL